MNPQLLIAVALLTIVVAVIVYHSPTRVRFGHTNETCVYVDTLSDNGLIRTCQTDASAKVIRTKATSLDYRVVRTNRERMTKGLLQDSVSTSFTSPTYSTGFSEAFLSEQTYDGIVFYDDDSMANDSEPRFTCSNTSDPKYCIDCFQCQPDADGTGCNMSDIPDCDMYFTPIVDESNKVTDFVNHKGELLIQVMYEKLTSKTSEQLNDMRDSFFGQRGPNGTFHFYPGFQEPVQRENVRLIEWEGNTGKLAFFRPVPDFYADANRHQWEILRVGLEHVPFSEFFLKYMIEYCIDHPNLSAPPSLGVHRTYKSSYHQMQRYHNETRALTWEWIQKLFVDGRISKKKFCQVFRDAKGCPDYHGFTETNDGRIFYTQNNPPRYTTKEILHAVKGPGGVAQIVMQDGTTLSVNGQDIPPWVPDS